MGQCPGPGTAQRISILVYRSLLVGQRYHAVVRCPFTLPCRLLSVTSTMIYRGGETEIPGRRSSWAWGPCHCENKRAVWLTTAREVITSLMDIPTQSCVLRLSPVGRSLLGTKSRWTHCSESSHPPFLAPEDYKSDCLSSMSPGPLCVSSV